MDNHQSQNQEIWQHRSLGMFISNQIRIFFVACLFLIHSVTNAKSDTPSQSINDINFYCSKGSKEAYFCTNIHISNPSYILTLPRLEKKKMPGNIHAFRIMPSITNLTQQTVLFARLKLSFWRDSGISKEFWIQQKLVPEQHSHTALSYLIRQDVPVQKDLYGKLLSITQNGLYGEMLLELLEIKVKQ